MSAIETVKKFTAVSNRPLIVGKDPPLSLIASLFNVGISGIELTFAACGAYNKTEAVAEYQKQISEYFYQTSGVNHGDAKR